MKKVFFSPEATTLTSRVSWQKLGCEPLPLPTEPTANTLGDGCLVVVETQQAAELKALWGQGLIFGIVGGCDCHPLCVSAASEDLETEVAQLLERVLSLREAWQAWEGFDSTVLLCGQNGEILQCNRQALQAGWDLTHVLPPAMRETVSAAISEKKAIHADWTVKEETYYVVARPKGDWAVEVIILGQKPSKKLLWAQEDLAAQELELEGKGLNKSTLLRLLRVAIMNKGEGMHMHYQPIVGSANWAWIGMEALARWNLKVGEEEVSVPPAVFIHLAEEFGLMEALGWILLDKALADIAFMQREGVFLDTAINISKDQLLLADFPSEIAARCAHVGVDKERVILELTESVGITQMNLAVKQAQRLRQEGFRLAIDDFGTGYNSMSLLSDLPVVQIKLHKDLIDRCGDRRTLLLMKTIKHLAAELKVSVVAEGVESDEQALYLSLLNITFLQGFYFGRPMPSSEFVPSYKKSLREQTEEDLLEARAV